MALYSYIVTHDTGFAPNPFFGYCTLACCKPGIRRHAKEGDWIVGLTPRAKGTGNEIVYFMEVEKSLSFNDYWRDARFRQKRPKLDAGLARKCGDNIYKPPAQWLLPPIAVCTSKTQVQRRAERRNKMP